MNTTTPGSKTLIGLLGGHYFESVNITNDELKNIKKLYKFKDDSDESGMMQAASDRNAFRFANHDGLRIIAWLAKYCEPDEDPVKLIIRLVSENGYDVDFEDNKWAFDDVEWDDEEKEEKFNE